MNYIYPKNINKYKGDIIEEKDRYKYVYKVSKNNFIIKHFNFTDKNKDKIYNDVIEFKKKNTIFYNKCLNKYSYNNDGSITVYFKNKNIIIDKEDINLLDDFIWELRSIKNNGIKEYSITTKINLNYDFTKYYSYLNSITPNRNYNNFKRYKSITFIFLKYGSKKYIKFKNNNSLDYRLCNIINNKNNLYVINNNINNNIIKKKIVNGILNIDDYWIVKGINKDKDNDIITRKFSFNKFGKLIAKKLAFEFKNRLINNGYNIIND